MLFPTASLLLLAVPLGMASPTPDVANSGGSTCAPASAASLSQAKQKFVASGLVPAYISSFNPTLLAQITYAPVTGGAKQVNFGNVFKTTETALQPTVFLTPEQGQSSSTTYSLFFLNFDNPQAALPPSLHLPFLHWQESGLKACSTAAGNQTQLFIASVPQSVNENRYTYLIYREPAGYVANPSLTTTRVITDIDAFAASQNLTLVGGNYFLEGQENNVPPVSRLA